MIIKSSKVNPLVACATFTEEWNHRVDAGLERKKLKVPDRKAKWPKRRTPRYSVDSEKLRGEPRVYFVVDDTTRQFSYPNSRYASRPFTRRAAAERECARLKVFDELGVIPNHKKEDPIIVGRIIDPRSPKYAIKAVTFMVAWHLNTNVL